MAKAAGYKLATYQSSDGPRAGLVVEDKVFDAAALTGKQAYASVLGILADWRAAEGLLRKAAASLGTTKTRATKRAKSRPLAKTKLLAPVRIMPTTPPRWRRATTGRRRPIRTHLA